jgi:hypothetical protein
MVFAYSGIEVHYHFCGKSGEVFSSVMIAGVDESLAGECVCSHQESGCCSKVAEGSASSCHESGDKSCCSDHISEMRTDVHYPAIHHFVSLLVPTVLILADDSQPAESAKSFSPVELIYSPPNQAFLSVFRL